MATLGDRVFDNGLTVLDTEANKILITSQEATTYTEANSTYALSKSKTDLFLRALESYIQAIVDVLNKQLIERLWELNGLPYDVMPTIQAGDVAPHDLREIAAFLRNLNGANIDVSTHPEVISDLMAIAELEYNPEINAGQQTTQETE